MTATIRTLIRFLAGRTTYPKDADLTLVNVLGLAYVHLPLPIRLN